MLARATAIEFTFCIVALCACGSTAAAPVTTTPPATSAAPPPTESSAPTAATAAPSQPLDPAALATLESECGDDGGMQVFSCMELGDRFRDGKGVSKDLEKGAAYYRRACDGSAPFGCLALTRVLLQTDPTHEELFDLMLKSCAPGMLDVCHEFGDLWRDGKGVAKNEDHARKLYEAGCEFHEFSKKSCAESGSETDCDPGLIGDDTNCRRLQP